MACLTSSGSASRFIYDADQPRFANTRNVHVPPIVEPPDVPQADLAEFGVSPDELTVLVMFDFNSIWQRKNPDGALEAFPASLSAATSGCGSC